MVNKPMTESKQGPKVDFYKKDDNIRSQSKYSYRYKFTGTNDSNIKSTASKRQADDQVRRESISRTFAPKSISAAKESSKDAYFKRKNVYQVKKVTSIVSSSCSANTFKRGLGTMNYNRIKPYSAIKSVENISSAPKTFKTIHELKKTNFSGKRNVLDSIERQPSK
jgi:hypothetical protein